MPRRAAKKETTEGENYFDKISQEVESNQSRLSLILGGLIILVVVILIFNYFNRGDSSLGPSQQTQGEDVSPENLPGSYTVKEGDTLFTIAEKYYKDGYKYQEIVEENNLINADQIEVGQVIQIPELAEATPEPTTPEETAITQPTITPAPDATIVLDEWGPKITSDTYTVVEGDWLSKIAARSYGDIFAYKRIAEANNISNPDLILPGQVLVIPR